MRAQIRIRLFLIKLSLACAFTISNYDVVMADAFTILVAPSSSSKKSIASIVVGKSIPTRRDCTSHLRFAPEDVSTWDRRAPPYPYEVQDHYTRQWENPMPMVMDMDERVENRRRPSSSSSSWSVQDSFLSSRNSQQQGNDGRMNSISEQFFVPRRQFRENPDPSRVHYQENANHRLLDQREYYQQQYQGKDFGQVVGSAYGQPGPYQQSTFGWRRFDDHHDGVWNEPQFPIASQEEEEESFQRQAQRRGYDRNYFVDPTFYHQKNGQYDEYYERARDQESSGQTPRQSMKPHRQWSNDFMGFAGDEKMPINEIVMSPLRGFEIMDRMLRDMMDGLDMINDVMDRLDFGFTTRMDHYDQVAIDNVLQDAYAMIVDDSVVTEILGESIRLGIPTAQSSSSTIFNGMRRSRMEMVIPIRGNRNMGQLRLLAGEDGIHRIEVEINGRVFEVQGNGRRNYGSRKDVDDDLVIDATVVE